MKREHRVTLTIDGIDEGKVDRLLDGLVAAAGDARPVISGRRGHHTVNVTFAVDAEDAAAATTIATELLKAALARGAFPTRPVLHAEAERVGHRETAAA
jgi:hypothetical protein